VTFTRGCTAALLCLFAFSPALASRTAVALDHGWRFLEAPGDKDNAKPGFDDSAWKSADLPHTWNHLGGREDGSAKTLDAYKGAAWYRLNFKAPVAAKGSRFFLQFDGVGAVADVWLNGHYLGKHEGAVSRFRFDATAAIVAGKDNLLAVKADNSTPAPGSTTAHVIPLSGDFFVHGGLYRGVSLIVAPPVHVDLMDFGGPGVYARTTKIDAAAAQVEVRTRLANDTAALGNTKLSLRILDGANKVVAQSSQAVKLPAHAVVERSAKLVIRKPHLWNGMADPYLYKVVVTLGADQVVQPLGLRTIAFDADKGFFLNGKHVALNGVALHQDMAGKGWAMSCADQKRDFDLVEDIGANTVRLAHYQHDQCSYDEADRRGLIVWAEIPLVNQVSFDGTPASPALAANAKQQLSELIRQNYNHPAIAMWSVGNEIDLRAIQNNGPSKAGPLVRDLAAQVHREDPSRPSTLADCCEQSPRADRDVLVGLADLAGYNRYFGWYYGDESDFGPMLDKAHAAHPKLPLSVSEYGAGAAMTQHSDDARGGPINPHGRPHPEEVQQRYHELSWQALAARPYIWGTYVWNMFDFASADRQEGDLTDINEKGLVTYDRETKKDIYFFFRANWNPAPTVRIVGHYYTDRPYQVLDIKAYSNAAKAVLTLNGKAVGTAPCHGGICLWKAVQLVPGSNALRVTADFNGKTVEDSVLWSWRGTPGTVRIKAGDVTGFTANGVRFGSDMYFAGGTGKGINPPDTEAGKRIAVAAAAPRLYDSYREGRFSYRIPLANGRYKVTLHFAEPAAKGQRVFDVTANGAAAIAKLDVFAEAGGRLRGLDKSFTAQVTDGVLLLEFTPRSGQALLSACEIVPD
jgi:beta-galactosidase